MKIGEKIRIFRQQKGYSQENLAQMLDISLNAYSKIERGETDPNFTRLEQIAEALQTSVLDIISHGEKHINYVQNSHNGLVGTGYVVNSIEPDLWKRLIEIETRISQLEKDNK